MSALAQQVGDVAVIAGRCLKRIQRHPDLLVGFTIQPVMWVLLFVYVFGGAIDVAGFSYVDFLIPGIAIQSLMFAGFATMLGLAEDLKKGLIDRFRSLPIAPSAVLAGRTSADLLNASVQLVIVVTVGTIAGFRFHTSVPEVLAGVVLGIAFAYMCSWGFACFGLWASSAESAQAMASTVLFPLTFVSAAFVPVDTMPAVLEAIAKANPVTTVIDAMRALWLGTPAGNDIWMAVVWIVGGTLLFSSVAVWRYRRAVGA